MTTKLGDITIAKQSGTILELQTANKFAATDVNFNIDVQTGAGVVTIASTAAEIEDDSNVNNIAPVIGSGSTAPPSTGYYLKVGASGSGNCVITSAGWLGAGTLGTATADTSYYFPVAAATATVSGTNTVTPSASVAGVNISLSNTNNGISITATGGGIASASVTATGNASGYAKNGVTLGSGTIVTTNSATTTASTYISGVTIPVPQDGTNTFTVTVPNGGNDTLTLTFSVAANGNWSLE